MKKLLIILLFPAFAYAQPCSTAVPAQSSNYLIPKSVVDLQTFLCVPQTVPGITFTFDTPTTLTGNKNITIVNTGTVPFNVTNGGVVSMNTGVIMRWTGSMWISTGGGTQAVAEPANTVHAGPSSGSPALATYRSLVVNDIPQLPYSGLSGLPSLFSGAYNDLTGKPTLFSGAYADLTGKPSLFSGVYADLTGKPALFSGAYADLTGKPDLNIYYLASNPSGYISSVPAQSFASLTGKPTTLSGYGITDAYPLSGNPSGFLSSVPAQSFSSLTGKPTTLSGYGITDAVPSNRSLTFSAGTGISLSAGTQDLSTNRTWTVTNTAPDQTVVLNAGRGIAITGTYPNFTIAMVTPTYSTTARSLNTNFTPNASKETFAFYTVTCQVTNPLLVGTSTASVFLEYSTNAGSSWNPVTSQANSSGVGVTVTLQLTNGQTGVVSGVIPAGALARLRSTTSGTATVTIVSSFEMVY